MPLNAEAEPVLFNRFISLDDPIRACRAHSETAGEIANGHMMRAVNTDFARSINRIQASPWHNLQNMTQVLLDWIPMMNGSWHIFRNVLVQRPAAKEVDKLHS